MDQQRHLPAGRFSSENGKRLLLRKIQKYRQLDQGGSQERLDPSEEPLSRTTIWYPCASSNDCTRALDHTGIGSSRLSMPREVPSGEDRSRALEPRISITLQPSTLRTLLRSRTTIWRPTRARHHCRYSGGQSCENGGPVVDWLGTNIT